MRPALLRLLKRPSALSVLDSLISLPVGVDQLDLGRTPRCTRCLSEDTQSPGTRPHSKSQLASAEERPSPSPKPAFRFRVHDIRAPQRQATTDTDDPDISIQDGTVLRLGCLGLQPEKLEYESDIGHADDIGTRLVDDPAHRNDIKLWEELLRYRQRHYGDKGTLEIWEGLTVRVDGVQLPVDGEAADFFWQSFVDVSFKRDVIMNEIANYALGLWYKRGKRWDKLYEAVVGGYIERGMTQQAVEWHKKLQHPHLACPNDIIRVLQPCIDAQQRTQAPGLVQPKRAASSLRVFRTICRLSRGHQIYVPIMSELLRGGHVEEVLRMHKFLTKQEDHPPTFSDLEPLLESTKAHGLWEIYRELHGYATERFPNEIEKPDGSDSAAQAELKGNVSHEEKPIRDELGARIFATEALNFQMILSGLRMFHVSAIGPQSLREMALRAHGSQDILNKLRELDQAGISIGDSVFARLLRKLATENRDIVLSDLLHSDEHPDALEDERVQESLLLSYYLSQDRRPYNMTLAILGEVSKDGPDLFNIHFRKHLAANEWSSASKVVDEMTLRGETINKESIDFMINTVLTPRRPGAGPVQGSNRSEVAEVSFMFRILQRIIPLGATVGPELWIELLKRFGMTGSWDELQTCCVWLARHYSPTLKQANTPLEIISLPTTPQPAHAGLIHRQGSALLETIFSKQMQSAIVDWGFQMRVSAKRDDYNPRGIDGETLVPWVRGLILLRELEQNGVRLWTSWISKACRHRLAVCFGRPRQSSRHMNRMLRRETPYSAERVVENITRVWGEPSLFGGQENLDFYRLINPPSSKMSLRRTGRTLWREGSLRGRAFVSSR
ncbi:hypothetical protein BO70DRAFT_360398 [Aspergillus heteromorphus CBS 117.55]|uniref:Uncharacterized protein n=1 Tax=Aspergillus heteromorphus CBS 117.55 TaxID=1448321 RepID=A0A317WMR3_9EURO|nr:uncharacterized protein BO70DRAFT_360398 [Aspergillus heteromorphus CBS 117.55]PWY87754.1 hypothetical protein BO70DRAFT_360398 [Aspergillus heteromorphus CBS 117.55]